MKCRNRVLMILTLVLPFAGLQAGLTRHLHMVHSIQPQPLERPLHDFPIEVDGWTGRDVAIADPEFLYGDQHLNRNYFHQPTSSVAAVWIGYSATGEDSNHNPQVCMPAHGLYEVEDSQTFLEMPDGKAPIRRLRFAHPDGRQDQWVYYWYYTLVPTTSIQELTLLQKLQLRRKQFAGVTLEVFAPSGATNQLALESFVRAVDRSFQQQLPEGAVRGSTIRPVYLENRGQVIGVEPPAD